MTETVTTYEPDNSLKKGYLHVFKDIINEIRRNRWLTYQLFRRNFFTMYKQSVLGLLWTFILPIVSVATFVILSSAGLFNVGTSSVPYPLYAMFGLAFWQLFSTGVVGGSTSLVQAGAMIVKINFSKKALVISSMGTTAVAFLIQIGLALILFAVYGVMPNVAILLVPILVIPMILLTLGLSFILSILNGVVRDLGNLIPIILTFLMFLTPVMYTARATGLLAQITMYNPVYYLVAVPRDLALTGTTMLWVGFFASSVLSVVVFLACLVAFHLTETRLAERI